VSPLIELAIAYRGFGTTCGLFRLASTWYAAMKVCRCDDVASPVFLCHSNRAFGPYHPCTKGTVDGWLVACRVATLRLDQGAAARSTAFVI